VLRCNEQEHSIATEHDYRVSEETDDFDMDESLLRVSMSQSLDHIPNGVDSVQVDDACEEKKYSHADRIVAVEVQLADDAESSSGDDHYDVHPVHSLVDDVYLVFQV